MVIVKWVLSVIANPVAVTLATVLNALKLSEDPPSWSHRGGPAPLKPDHWLPLVVEPCCDGLAAARALLSP